MDARQPLKTLTSNSVGLFQKNSNNETAKVELKAPISFEAYDFKIAMQVSDNSEIVIGFENGGIVVIDGITGECTYRYKYYEDMQDEYLSNNETRQEKNLKQTRHMVALKPHVFCMASDKEITIVDVEKGESTQTFQNHPEFISALLATNDGGIFIGSYLGDSVRLQDAETGMVRWKRENGYLPLFDNPALNLISKLFSTHEGIQKSVNYLASYLFHQEEVGSFSTATNLPNGEIACGTAGGVIYILNLQSGNLSNIFKGYDGKKVLRHAEDCWQIYTKQINVLRALSNNDIVSGSQNGPLVIWDYQTGQLKHKLITDARSDFRVAHIEVFDNYIMATSHNEAALHIWDSNTGEFLKEIQYGFNDAFYNNRFCHNFTVAKNGDILLLQLSHDHEKYYLYRVPLNYLMNHELKSVHIKDIPFPGDYPHYEENWRSKGVMRIL